MRSFGRGSDDDQRFSAQVQRGFIAEYIKTEIPLSVQVCSSLLLPSHFLQLLPLLPLPLAISNFIAEYNAKSVMSGHYHGHTAPLSKLWSYGRYKFTPSVALHCYYRCYHFLSSVHISHIPPSIQSGGRLWV